jgi:hypothetical protein
LVLRHNSVWVANADGSGATQIYRTPGDELANYNGTEHSPEWSRFDNRIHLLEADVKWHWSAVAKYSWYGTTRYYGEYGGSINTPCQIPSPPPEPPGGWDATCMRGQQLISLNPDGSNPQVELDNMTIGAATWNTNCSSKSSVSIRCRVLYRLRVLGPTLRYFTNPAGPMTLAKAEVGQEFPFTARAWGDVPAINHIVSPDGSQVVYYNYYRQEANRALTSNGAVLATWGSGSRATENSDWGFVPASLQTCLPPTSVTPPLITGLANEGERLQTAGGTWNGCSSSLSYQWQRCNQSGAGCTDLFGATALTYTPSSADVGSSIRVRVKATNEAGETIAFSSPSDTIGPRLTRLERYKPQIRYDRFETYRADAVDEITDNYTSTESNLLWTTAFGYLAASDPSYPADDLTLGYLGSSYPSSFPNSQTASTGDYIDEANTYAEDAQRLHGLPKYRDIIYGRTVPLGNGEKILQYWFFLYYNHRPLVGAHEGDWEMIQIHLDSADNPIRAAYAQHNSGERCEWINVQRTATGRPIVYTALGSHASYFSSGEHLVDAGAVNDYAGGDGEWVTPTISDISQPPAWLDWPGRFGASTEGAFRSPTSPKWQGTKWEDPLAWQSSIDGCTENQTQQVSMSVARGQGAGASSRALTATKSAVPTPPAPVVGARRDGDRVIIRYRFPEWPSSRARKPVELITSVDPAGNKYPPLTFRWRVTSRAGRVSQPLGLGTAPFRVLVSAMASSGARSRAVIVPLK